MDRKAYIHAPLYAGVMQDIDMLHARYLEAETKNFSAFAAVFREFDFSSIYAGRIASYEAIEFAENALQIAASYMGSKRVAKTNREATLDDRRFGVFLTYSLFYLQPTDYVYQVPVTPNLMKEMQQLVRVVTLQRELDTLACLYKLLDDSAFRIFAFDKSYDPQCNRKYDVPDLKSEGLEDIEPPLPRAESLLKSEQMNYMRLLHTTYVEGKNKLEETKRLRTVRENAADEMETIIKKAKVEFEGKKDEMMQLLIHTSNTNEGAEDEEENEDEEGTDAEDAEESGQSRATSYMSN